MSLRSCGLNNNFNEAAGCLNARLNHAYTSRALASPRLASPRLPSVLWRSLGQTTSLSFLSRRRRIRNERSIEPRKWDRGWAKACFCRSACILNDDRTPAVYYHASSFIPLSRLLLLLQSAMGSSNLRRRRSTPRSIPVRTRSWCVGSSARGASAFGRRIRRYVTLESARGLLIFRRDRPAPCHEAKLSRCDRITRTYEQ